MQRIVVGMRHDPAACDTALADLFTKMSTKGGVFGADRIEWFNGGLFDNGDTISLTVEELAIVETASVIQKT